MVHLVNQTHGVQWSAMLRNTHSTRKTDVTDVTDVTLSSHVKPINLAPRGMN